MPFIWKSILVLYVKSIKNSEDGLEMHEGQQYNYSLSEENDRDTLCVKKKVDFFYILCKF